MLGIRQLDHLQPQSVFGGLGGLDTGVTLVDKGYFDAFASRFLDRLGHLVDLSTILFIGRCNMQPQP